MRVISLIISFTSLMISLIALLKLLAKIKNQQHKISQLEQELIDSHLSKQKAYDFVREQRNDAIREQLKYEDKQDHCQEIKKKDAYKIGVFVAEQKIKMLKTIENNMCKVFFE